MLLPVQNLPIPAYNRRNTHHRNLAEQSQLAHQRVKRPWWLNASALLATTCCVDAAMQPILASY